jgi:AcrR family transcriptional regulator
MKKSSVVPQQASSRIRLKPEERRRQIVEAAFTAVAADGFEGLRTRDIAASVGINSATLHHYFPTKEDLVASIADLLEARLQTERAPLHPKDEFGSLDPFGHQFEDLIFYHLKTPEMLSVYREFVARAPRDAVISTLVTKLNAGWKQSIAAALSHARAQGVLRADIDIDAAAGLVLCTAWGLVAQIFVSPNELQAAAAQLRMLIGHDHT